MDVKEIVRKEYGDIAAGRAEGCCGSGSSEMIALQIGYDRQDLGAVMVTSLHVAARRLGGASA